MSKEENNTFDPEALSEIEKQTQEYVSNIEADIQKKKQEETKTGRKSKTAKEAESTEIMIGIAQGLFTGMNQLAKKWAPELEHDEVELETMAKLSAPIASKHFDIKASKYEEEYRLLSYLMVIEAPKVEALLSRLKAEAKEKRKKRQQEATKKKRDGIKIPLNEDPDPEQDEEK